MACHSIELIPAKMQQIPMNSTHRRIQSLMCLTQSAIALAKADHFLLITCTKKLPAHSVPKKNHPECPGPGPSCSITQPPSHNIHANDVNAQIRYSTDRQGAVTPPCPVFRVLCSVILSSGAFRRHLPD